MGVKQMVITGVNSYVNTYTNANKGITKRTDKHSIFDEKI